MDLFLELFFLSDQLSYVFLRCLELLMDVRLVLDCLLVSQDVALVREVVGVKSVDFGFVFGDRLSCGFSELFVVVISLAKSFPEFLALSSVLIDLGILLANLLPVI
jgi:hypothetical protein